MPPVIVRLPLAAVLRVAEAAVAERIDGPEIEDYYSVEFDLHSQRAVVLGPTGSGDGPQPVMPPVAWDEP
jgi:hypothetical protein